MRKFLATITKISTIMTTAITALLISTSATANQNVEYQKFESDVQVIDVRTAAEWETGHLPTALHIPHVMILEGEGLADLDKTKPVVLYCRSGGRAQRAKDYLEAQGFTNVKNLGGISDLVITQQDDEKK